MSTSPPATRQDLLQAFDALLQPERFKDYGPNGLQVEGKAEVRKIVSGVTASRALIAAAIEAQADAIFVHHGLFWRGQDGRVTGWMKQRLALLLAHDINLYAYHLPLDAHPQLGNNAQLGVQLGLTATARFGEQDLGFLGGKTDGGSFNTAEELAETIKNALKRPVVVVGSAQSAIKKIAWCTGGAQGYFEAAIAAGQMLHHRRNFRAASPLRPRDGCALFCLWPPCVRALWCAGSRCACGRTAGPGARIYRY